MIGITFPQFKPHPLIRSGHAQTILGPLLGRRKFPYHARRHHVTLPDGDQIVLHDDRPGGWHAGHRAALLVHGLAGCHLSSYMQRVAHKLNACGIRTFRMDLRGCGAGYHVAQQSCHAGRSEDASAAVRYISAACPQSPLTAIGFSLGGNIVLKMLGELGDRRLGWLDSCVAVAPPIDIEPCCRNMELRKNRLYTRSFVRGLVRQVKIRGKTNAAIRAIPRHPLPQTILQFDERYTAPLGGFADALDYYAQASAAPLLRHVHLPTFVLAAEDDPIIPVSIFHQAHYSPSTTLYITDHGGHVGYLGVKGVDPDRRWMDWRIVDWIRSMDLGARCESIRNPAL